MTFDGKDDYLTWRHGDIDRKRQGSLSCVLKELCGRNKILKVGDRRSDIA